MEDIMSKRMLTVILCGIVTLFFTSCSRQYDTSDTYILYQDDPYTYKIQGNSSNMAECEDGYYFFLGYYLYYADKTTMKPVILCNKPNCLHSDETDPTKITSCNACFPSGHANEYISYFDGNIYVLEGDTSRKSPLAHKLIRLSKDGTKRKTVLHFKYPPQSLAIHRGKVYTTSSLYDEDGASVYGVDEYDLGKSPSQKPVTIFKGTIPGGAIRDIRCYGQNVYFNEFAMTKDIRTVRIQRYDLNTKKTSCLMQEKGDDFPGTPTFLGNHLLYNYDTVDAAGNSLQSKNYICDLDGKNVKESFPTDNYQDLSTDGRYIYLDDIKWSPLSKPADQLALTVTDLEGRSLASTPTGGYNKTSSGIICGGEKHLFLYNQTDTAYQLFYANKEEFENGKINFHLLIEISPDKMTPGYVTYD